MPSRSQATVLCAYVKQFAVRLPRKASQLFPHHLEHTLSQVSDSPDMRKRVTRVYSHCREQISAPWHTSHAAWQMSQLSCIAIEFTARKSTPSIRTWRTLRPAGVYESRMSTPFQYSGIASQ